MGNKKVVVYEIKSNSRSLHDDLIKNIKKKNDDVINQAISYVQSNQIAHTADSKFWSNKHK